jgi:transposase
MKYEARQVRNEIIVNLAKTGMSPQAIGSIVNLGQRMISTLLSKHANNEPMTRKSTGSPPQLSRLEVSELGNFLEKGAIFYGFEGLYWTHSRVGYVINKEYGVQYEDKQVGRILASINWTRQKPQKKDAKQSAAKVEKWQTEDLASLKKRL